MKRRRLLVSALAAGPALLLGWSMLPPRSRIGMPDALPERNGQVALDGWLRIAVDGTVSLVMPHAEMGQGVHTALAMLVAEELRIPTERIVLEPAGADSRYGNVTTLVESVLYQAPPQQEPGTAAAGQRAARWLLAKAAREFGLVATGGSSSVADLYPVLRLAAATARARLLGAASLQWRLPAAELRVADGRISHASGPQASYGELAALAAATPAGEVSLTDPSSFRVIGTPVPRRDTRAKVDGSARFGIDQQPPGLLHAAIAMGAVRGAEPGAVDVDALLRRPGVLRVVRLPALAGAPPALAVVARRSWQALQAARLLQGDAGGWQPPPGPRPDGEQIRRALDDQALAAAQGQAGFVFHQRGDPDRWLAAAGRVIEASYRAPYLAHATLEPPNATARVADGRVQVWAPTQAPTLARAAAARVAGVDERQVELQVPYLGGGFGRRLEVDLVAQAVHVALETGGAPVQLLWSREMDLRNDFYRPAAAATCRAALGADGNPEAIVIGSAGDAVMPRYLQRTMPTLAVRWDAPDKTTAEGLFGLPYDVPRLRVQHAATRLGVPVGSWRSVGHSHNAFFAESFADELAHAAAADPVRWRLDRLRHLPRHAEVLRLAADAAGWGGPLPAGHARGVALHESFGTVVALVAEVSADAAGALRARRFTAAVDCGLVVNPRIAAHQIEGAILFGLGAALHGRIDIAGGAVRASNFHDHRMLKMAESPPVRTLFVDSPREPTGLGEPGTPPVAPALANAWFALTGQRLRELPLAG